MIFLRREPVALVFNMSRVVQQDTSRINIYQLKFTILSGSSSFYDAY